MSFAKRTARWLRSRDRVKWYLVAPTAALLAFVTLYPVLQAFYMSLHRWVATLPGRPFVGGENYLRLLEDPRFFSAMNRTLLFVGTALLLEFLIGFGLALLFWESFPGRALVTTLLLIPMMIPRIVTGFTARMAFNAEYGFVNQILSLFYPGTVSMDWLGNPEYAQLMIVLADVWQWTPFVFILLYSGLVSLSTAPYEAARIDGANTWQRFWHVTLPRMRYIIVVTLLIRGIDLVKLFDKILVSTSGGPGRATETIGVYIYYLGWQFWDMGYAATVTFGLLIGIVVVAMGSIQLFLRRDV